MQKIWHFFSFFRGGGFFHLDFLSHFSQKQYGLVLIAKEIFRIF